MSAEIPLAAPDEWTPDTRLIDLLLKEQQTLSAVDEFSKAHAELPHDRSHYETLIPNRLPGAAEQFAFRVDLDACTGCKACVTACHSLNGLEPEETWRSVGLVETLPDEVVAGVAGVAHQQTVTSACHHCQDPACMAGCPVRAYEKDATTGIVRHLDDQCIGCRYCQLTCPYDVPTYSERLGIVRKCDMCQDRLGAGEAPACVQGCPNQSISISIVSTQPVENAREKSAGALLHVVDGAMPSSHLTRPTTQYISARPLGDPLYPAQLGSVEPSEGHSPLAVMLVLTQMSIGTLVMSSLAIGLFGPPLGGGRTESALAHAIALTLASLIGFAGLGASILHLGRPQWAFRAFLGLRTSWMSREIIVLGGYAGLMSVACGLAWLDWGVEAGQIDTAFAGIPKLAGIASVAAAATGLLGLFCSIQIYAVTGRPLWRFDRTALRFGSTTVLLGMAGFALALSLTAYAAPQPASAAAAAAAESGLPFAVFAGVAILSAIKLWAESGMLIHAKLKQTIASTGQQAGSREGIALERTRILLDSSLRIVNQRRRQLAMVAGIALSVLCASLVATSAPLALIIGVALIVVAGSIGGELLERSLFFRSEATPAMPRVN